MVAVPGWAEAASVEVEGLAAEAEEAAEEAAEGAVVPPASV